MFERTKRDQEESTKKNEQELEDMKSQVKKRHEDLQGELLRECRALVADEAHAIQKLRTELASYMADGEKMARETVASDFQSFQSTVMEVLAAQTKEFDRLKRTTDIDSLWSSFAHVGGLVQELQKRVDKL